MIPERKQLSWSNSIHFIRLCLFSIGDTHIYWFQWKSEGKASVFSHEDIRGVWIFPTYPLKQMFLRSPAHHGHLHTWEVGGWGPSKPWKKTMVLLKEKHNSMTPMIVRCYVSETAVEIWISALRKNGEAQKLLDILKYGFGHWVPLHRICFSKEPWISARGGRGDLLRGAHPTVQGQAWILQGPGTIFRVL